MKRFIWVFSVLILCLLSLSCDILRNSPFEVVSWTPGEGYHSDPGTIQVSLLLSQECDRVLTEQAFSLTEDRRSLKGSFSWEGRRLTFTPAAPLEADKDYVISLGIGAQNSKGLSLEQKFDAAFSTRHSGGRSLLLRTVPEHGGFISEGRGEFRLYFSQPVRLLSCLDHISFSPSTPGSWRLDDGNRTAVFTPRDPWQAETAYSIRVDSQFSGVSGDPIGTEYVSAFVFGDDHEKPLLLRALAFAPNGTEEEIPFDDPGDPQGYSFTQWEKDTRLVLVFSKPVDLSILRNFIILEPNVSLVMESPPILSERAVFRFAEFPEWGSSFQFRVSRGIKDSAGNESEDEYVFRITIGGIHSKAPRLAGIGFPLDPGARGNAEGIFFTEADLFNYLSLGHEPAEYPYGAATTSWIELYFEVAPGTGIDTFSLMDLFRVEATNGAMSFSPRHVLTENFTWPLARPGWEHYQRIEVQGIYTNMAFPGIVTVRIRPGLRDLRGNQSSNDFRISLLK
ncbi:MAG: Ig-like domain-containing protein [Treponema sp.]|nr:Ig-like domain-containing protein [Treponema sp.]